MRDVACKRDADATGPARAKRLAKTSSTQSERQRAAAARGRRTGQKRTGQNRNGGRCCHRPPLSRFRLPSRRTGALSRAIGHHLSDFPIPVPAEASLPRSVPVRVPVEANFAGFPAGSCPGLATRPGSRSNNRRSELRSTILSRFFCPKAPVPPDVFEKWDRLSPHASFSDRPTLTSPVSILANVAVSVRPMA